MGAPAAVAALNWGAPLTELWSVVLPIAEVFCFETWVEDVLADRVAFPFATLDKPADRLVDADRGFLVDMERLLWAC